MSKKTSTPPLKIGVTPANRRQTGPIPGGEQYRWRPGQSGNPSGRPKMGSLSRACREVLERIVPGDRQGRTYAQAIADRLGELALKGHGPSIRELADRAEGRAGQSLEIETRPVGAFAADSRADATPELEAEALDSGDGSPS